MKATKPAILGAMFALSVVLSTLHAQLPPPGPALRLEPRTNAWDLVVDSLSSTGALFLYRAPDLSTLVDSPTLMLQTNTPLTNGLRLPVLPASGFPNQGFFSAAYWLSRSVDEFGDPESGSDSPIPAMILLTSGLPTNLLSGQTFTVDFFLIDPTTGQAPDLSGPVSILVLQQSDGSRHPDAQVSPATGVMTNGMLQIKITVQAATSLDGYTLGLGPANSSFLFPEAVPALAAAASPSLSSPLDSFLVNSSNLGQDLLGDLQALAAYSQKLRKDNADPNPAWDSPIFPGGRQTSVLVSGTYGEWRGGRTANEPEGHVHQGLDLAALAASTIVPSRSGVVSCIGTMANPAMGDYIVIDHGDGWFSRYLHLDHRFIYVKPLQPVVRGFTAMASQLYNNNWPVHLHFEIRHDADEPRWGNPWPGRNQDPLQTPGIFSVPSAAALPRLEQFGLTRSHLGKLPFEAAVDLDLLSPEPPSPDVTGAVYLFAKFVDPEPKPGAERRLGLRAMRFQPEGASQPDEIRPLDSDAIDVLRPPGTDEEHGFARYNVWHVLNPDPENYFRYWWLWDTSSYAKDRRGPRSLVLTGENYSGASSNYYLAFGPQIKADQATPIGGQRYQFTLKAYLGTNNLEKSDRYRLDIIQPTGLPLEGVSWEEDGYPLPGSVTGTFSEHLAEFVYAFTLPANADPATLKLRVSSRLVPDIAHEVKLEVQTLTVLHYFSGGADGARPHGALILSANTLYGTAEYGGSWGSGTVFAVNTNGTGFRILHSFTAGIAQPWGYTNSDGLNPWAGLILSGNTLYGTAQGGGISANGTVFAVNSDGTGFRNLHSFTWLNADTNDGSIPYGRLLLSGNILYGTTLDGGHFDAVGSMAGTVFKVTTAGTAFANLHMFAGYSPISDGGNPAGELILSGNILYGTTTINGSLGGGTIFKINTVGTGFTTLHSFNDNLMDGAGPNAGLVLSGNTLYGTTGWGGIGDEGTVFKVNTTGTGFTTLIDFARFAPRQGSRPMAGLVLSGNTLYGTTDAGTVFAVNTDGTGFKNLYIFNATSDGGHPAGALILSGNTLYGTMEGGGTFGHGTVFALSLGLGTVR